MIRFLQIPASFGDRIFDFWRDEPRYPPLVLRVASRRLKLLWAATLFSSIACGGIVLRDLIVRPAASGVYHAIILAPEDTDEYTAWEKPVVGNAHVFIPSSQPDSP